MTPLRTDGELITAFHLAALNHGVFLAPRGLLALSTVLDDGHLDDATWARGRGWALWKALITLARRPNDALARHTLDAVLADQAREA